MCGLVGGEVYNVGLVIEEWEGNCTDVDEEVITLRTVGKDQLKRMLCIFQTPMCIFCLVFYCSSDLYFPIYYYFLFVCR